MLSARAAHHIDWIGPTEIRGHQIRLSDRVDGGRVGRSVGRSIGLAGYFKGSIWFFHAVPSAWICTARRARNVRADGVCTTRGIFRLGLLDGSRHAAGKHAGFLKTAVDRRTHGIYAAAIVHRQTNVTSGVHLTPGLASPFLRLVPPRRAAPRKGKRESLSREWPDVSPARLCLTPRIFPLNFPDAGIYHRLHLPEKLAPRAQPRSDSHYDRPEIQRNAYRTAR